MPAWVIDLGRWGGALVVYGMVAALSGAALIPCYFAFLWIEYETSAMWAVFSLPFLYALWGTLYSLGCVVYKRLVFYQPREGEFGLFSWNVVGWATTGQLTNWANILFLQHWKGTPFLNLYLRLMGARIGRRVSINTIHVYEWDLVDIGDDAILGGDCVVQGHILEGAMMKMRPVKIGKGALVGTGAKMMPGCSLGAKSVLAAGSIMKKDLAIPDGEVWGGTPPKLIRARGL